MCEKLYTHTNTRTGLKRSRCRLSRPTRCIAQGKHLGSGHELASGYFDGGNNDYAYDCVRNGRPKRDWMRRDSTRADRSEENTAVLGLSRTAYTECLMTPDAFAKFTILH